MRPFSKHTRAFTLIELLVVIAIIIILAGLLFPAYQAVQNQAKRTQAKNDLTQIVTAVNAYYTEYGKYPLVAAETIYGPAGSLNDGLFYTLRAVDAGAVKAMGHELGGRMFEDPLPLAPETRALRRRRRPAYLNRHNLIPI